MLGVDMICFDMICFDTLPADMLPVDMRAQMVLVEARPVWMSAIAARVAAVALLP